MRTPLLALSLLAAAPTLAAQNFDVSTLTTYGVLVSTGDRAAFDGVRAGESIGRGLAIHAGDRDGPFAATSARVMASRDAGVGVVIHEHGRAVATNATRNRAGTSPGSNNANNAPDFGPHALRMIVRAPAGTRGKVLVVWAGRATDNASAGAVVDIGADNDPEFVGRADGNREQQTFDVRADARGIVIDIATVGHAAGGNQAAGYGAELGVYFRAADDGGCRVTPFGERCGGTLLGRADVTDRGVHVGLGVSGAAPGSIGILVIGNRLDTPVPLPGSDCVLAVFPRETLAFNINRDGNALLRLRLPARDTLMVDFQVVTADLGRGGLELASTNGLNVACRRR